MPIFIRASGKIGHSLSLAVLQVHMGCCGLLPYAPLHVSSSNPFQLRPLKFSFSADFKE